MAGYRTTTYRHDYKPPSSPTFLTPGPPPALADTPGTPTGTPLERCAQLAARERLLCSELLQLRCEISELCSKLATSRMDGSDGSCPSPEPPSPPECCRSAAPPLHTGVPMAPQVMGLLHAQRDPASFRQLPCGATGAQSPHPVSSTSTPVGISAWFGPHVSLSEYQDTISKTGRKILLSSQQFLEPLPSSRHRAPA
ncbi:uncharacterized protein LOC134536181 [Bacillus rossius redtenbacheri]|uniref:uncharacterized protein LOC134536181 n=1 Tax=Bacillus rossius redtenbacheri TaxID=93214 RepID=UPI002FDDCA0B